MKTKTNFKKTAIRSGAVVVSFVLISFTVSAQGFWKKLLTNSSFNEIAIAMIEQPEGVNASGTSAAGSTSWNTFDLAFDPALELEGWMSDEDYFYSSEFQSVEASAELNFKESEMAKFDLQADVNESLKIESWMLQENYWIR
ncbi:MAG TPA: hypothetical protein VFD91_08270 [Mariniphaga sp.]|nr:hypothetical protein [Mariniphaga sp.]